MEDNIHYKLGNIDGKLDTIIDSIAITNKAYEGRLSDLEKKTQKLESQRSYLYGLVAAISLLLISTKEAVVDIFKGFH